MTKDIFINELKDKLKGLPKEEIDERISFYEELIDDMIEDGKTVDEALEKLGTIEEVSAKITSEVPLTKIVKERIKPKKELKAWEIVLIILGFPLWFPLVLTGIILLLTFSIILWVLVLVSYIVTISIGISSIGVLILFFISLFSGSFDMFVLGTTLACFGLTILLFFASYYFGKGIVKLHKLFFLSLKKGLIKGNKQ